MNRPNEYSNSQIIKETLIYASCTLYTSYQHANAYTTRMIGVHYTIGVHYVRGVVIKTADSSWEVEASNQMTEDVPRVTLLMRFRGVHYHCSEFSLVQENWRFQWKTKLWADARAKEIFRKLFRIISYQSQYLNFSINSQMSYFTHYLSHVTSRTIQWKY